MCGFVGFLGKGDYDRKDMVEQMSEIIKHRGPDSEGTFVDDYVGIGFRRLGIIDLKGGTQPIYSADGRYLIVFNGEILNYRELRLDLIKNHGCRFKTNSDTEVILQSYIVYGNEAASRLRGMFAFLIYDREKHSLYGARDSFGLKPFYYAHMNGTYFFGSEIKSFLPHPDFVKEINPDAVKMYMIFQYSAMKETLFKGVYKLKPGSYITCEEGKFEEVSFFDPTFDVRQRNMKETIDVIDKSVLDSVEYNQVSDVEIGSFISGGVDSSYIAATARPMKTYTVGFENSRRDETETAREVCDDLELSNQKKIISADEFFSILPTIQYHADEPLGNPSAVPMYYLSQMAARELKVVLTGEGADEMFGGYESYVTSPSEEAGKPVEETYIGQEFIMGNDEANRILKPKYQSDRTYQDVTRPFFDQVKDCDDVHKKMFLDLHLWLPNDILLRADKMTMACSLEGRAPYVDLEVWSTARSLDSKYDVDGNITKAAFRQAALRHVPKEWTDREKLGYPIPLSDWLAEDKYYDQVKKCFEQDYVSEFFDQEQILGWLEDHHQKAADNSKKIYTVYSFLLWYDQFFLQR